SLGNQSVSYDQLGDFSKAMKCAREQEVLARTLGVKDGLARSLFLQSVYLNKYLKQSAEARSDALMLAEEAFQVAKECNSPRLIKLIEPQLLTLRGLNK